MNRNFSTLNYLKLGKNSQLTWDFPLKLASSLIVDHNFLNILYISTRKKTSTYNFHLTLIKDSPTALSLILPSIAAHNPGMNWWGTTKMSMSASLAASTTSGTATCLHIHFSINKYKLQTLILILLKKNRTFIKNTWVVLNLYYNTLYWNALT